MTSKLTKTILNRTYNQKINREYGYKDNVSGMRV